MRLLVNEKAQIFYVGMSVMGLSDAADRFARAIKLHRDLTETGAGLR
jgi:hypothetical protein